MPSELVLITYWLDRLRSNVRTQSRRAFDGGVELNVHVGHVRPTHAPTTVVSLACVQLYLNEEAGRRRRQ